MDFHLEHEIRLSEESEYKSLYKWSLQEFGKDGQQIGSAQIPWDWTLYFTASELRYRKAIQLALADQTDGKDRLYKPAEESESITATLHPGICRNGKWLDRDTAFSMFGTDRTIKDFNLNIERLDDGDSDERCHVWGCPSYTAEIDFHDETSDDTILFTIFLSPKKFDDLCEMAINQSADQVQVSVGRVSGAYSEWSPSISTNNVKVLTADTEHPVVIPAGCVITPPKLGTVGHFSLTILRRTQLSIKQDLRPVDIGKVFAEDDDESDSVPMAESAYAEPDRNGAILALLNRAEKAVGKLRTPLWILVALLVLLLLK